MSFELAYLKEQNEIFKKTMAPEMKLAMKKAVQLMEKEEPGKVNYSSDGFADGKPVYDVANCPECNYEIEEASENWLCNYCPICGKKLEW